MKITLRSPDGTTLEYEREPMDEERFRWVCYVLLAAIAAAFFLGFFIVCK